MLSSPTKYQIVFLNSFPFDCYVIPLLLLGALTSPRARFQRVNDEKTRKNRRFFVRLPTIAHNTRPVVSTSGFRRSPGPPLSGNGRGIVPAHHHGHQNGQQVWCLFRRFFLACNPVVRRDDTEQILTRWWRPVASSEALDPLHQAMYAALHRRIITAVNTSRNSGVLLCIVDFNIDHNSR
jgi:hypothetical protein